MRKKQSVARPRSRDNVERVREKIEKKKQIKRMRRISPESH